MDEQCKLSLPFVANLFATECTVFFLTLKVVFCQNNLQPTHMLDKFVGRLFSLPRQTTALANSDLDKYYKALDK